MKHTTARPSSLLPLLLVCVLLAPPLAATAGETSPKHLDALLRGSPEEAADAPRDREEDAPADAPRDREEAAPAGAPRDREEDAPADAPRDRPDCPPPSDTGRCLGERLRRLASAPALREARLGALVGRLDDGAVLFSERAGESFLPASTTKLLVAAAALHHLGPEHRFRTEVLSDSQEGDRIRGNLYVRGWGDPSIDAATLLSLAEALRERGIGAIEGRVIVDGAAFDDERLPPGFARRTTDAAYRAAVGAFAAYSGAVRVAIYPGPAPGAPCRVDLGLGGRYFELSNGCRTVAGKASKPTLATERVGDRMRLVVAGQMGSGAPRVVTRRRTEHPELHAAYAFSEALTRLDITLGGGPRLGATPSERQLRITHHSAPLSVLLRPLNKDSDNFYAEMILKALGGEVFGHPATWEQGQRAVMRYLDEVGAAMVKEYAHAAGDEDLFPPALFAAALLDRDAYLFSNGSGLYDATRVSPALLFHVLRAAARDPLSGADFVQSLPIAGRDGTLRRRMRDTPAAGRARGKTGTLNRVNTLAGLVQSMDGARYVFVLLANETTKAHADVRQALDRMVAAISRGCGP